MIAQKVIIASIATLMLGLALARASECTYKISRDFRNIQSDVYRSTASTGDVMQLLNETEDTLVRSNTDTNIVEPGLARAWEYDAPNSRFIFSLSQHCRWSDGTQLIADDFVYGFQELYSRGAAPTVGGNLIAGAKGVIENGAALETLEVKALSEDKLSVGITGDPGVALLYLTYSSFSPLPTHVFNAEHIPLASPRRTSIGPFRVRSVAKDIIVLDRNPYYCTDEKINIDRIELVNRKQGYWEFSQLMAGKLDMVRYTPVKQLQILQANGGESPLARVELIDEQRQTYLLLNPLHEGFVHLEVRQKLSSAIDYNSLVSRGNSYTKIREVAKTLFYDLPNYENYAYSLDVNSYQKGIDALRKTMQKYGYSGDKPLKTSISTYPLERFETTAKMISSMLRQAHFDIKFVKTQSISDAVKQSDAGRFEMFFWSWTMDYSDPQSSLDGLKNKLDFLLAEENSLVGSSELKKRFIEPLKVLLTGLNQSPDQSERFKILQRVEELIVNSGIAIPLYTEHSPIVVSNRVSTLNGQFPHTRSISLSDCTQIHKGSLSYSTKTHFPTRFQ